MRKVAAGVAVLGFTLAGSAHAQSVDGVRVEHAAARMVVIPEARTTISVTVTDGDPRLPRLVVRQTGAGVSIEGGLERRIEGCRGGVTNTRLWGSLVHTRDDRAVQIAGVGRVELGQLPVVTAHVPMNAKIAAGDAVFGQVGPATTVDFTNTGCGDWRVADVRGALAVVEVGSGDVHAGAAQSVHARVTGSGDITMGAVGGHADALVAGSGDIDLGDVSGPLEVQVAGSGDIRVASVNGPVKARIAASGDINIDHGRAPNLAVNMTGSGDFTFEGTAGALSASLVGSGDIKVAHVDGPVAKSVVGTGDIQVGR